jgi:hypothetical protein
MSPLSKAGYYSIPHRYIDTADGKVQCPCKKLIELASIPTMNIDIYAAIERVRIADVVCVGRNERRI